MEQYKLEFNQRMDLYRDAVNAMTPIQIQACAYLFGTAGCGWNKENMLQSLQDEKHDLAN